MDPKLKGAHRVAVKFVTNYTPLTERVFAIRYHVVEKMEVLGGPTKFSSCKTTFGNECKGRMDQAPEPTSHVSKEEIKVTDLGGGPRGRNWWRSGLLLIKSRVSQPKDKEWYLTFWCPIAISSAHYRAEFDASISGLPFSVVDHG
jgi:hypothetical protein